VLEKGDKTMRYFSKDNGFENAGKRLKGQFEISELTRTQLIDQVDKHKFVLKMVDLEAGDLYISFETPLERFKVQEELYKCAKAQEAAVNSGLVMPREPVAMSDKKKHKREIMAATAQADTMMEQLVVMLHKGEITSEDYDAIIAGDVAEVVPDENTNKGNRATNYSKGSAYESDDDDEADEEDFGVQLPCQTCFTVNNTLYGPRCRFCKAFLSGDFMPDELPEGLFGNAIEVS
jgi:hypothetical protein